jgi:hypothetical protein
VEFGGFCISPRKGSIQDSSRLEDDPLPLLSVLIDSMHVDEVQIDGGGIEAIVFSVSTPRPGRRLHGSLFVKAGEPSPYRDISEVPQQLRAFIEPAETLETAESGENVANYSPGVVYLTNPDGSRGRAIRRQVAELSSARAEQEWAEQAAEAQATLDKETEAALQDAHDVHIGLELASAEIMHRDRDAAPDLIMAQRDAEDRGEAETRVTAPRVVPAQEQEPASKPRERRRK